MLFKLNRFRVKTANIKIPDGWVKLSHKSVQRPRNKVSNNGK